MTRTDGPRRVKTSTCGGSSRTASHPFSADSALHHATRQPTSQVHGDAHPGQLVRTPGGRVVCDFDAACVGPPTLRPDNAHGRHHTIRRIRRELSLIAPGPARHPARRAGPRSTGPRALRAAASVGRRYLVYGRRFVMLGYAFVGFGGQW
ncbi:phosphotransferase [Amycolatopsis sp. WAC 01376]|uniref:phosphotransferase n=1 Tax=Amycolatopsis sp. WAC 01376 TaxID=2203195 RepID=UPI0035174609